MLRHLSSQRTHIFMDDLQLAFVQSLQADLRILGLDLNSLTELQGLSVHQVDFQGRRVREQSSHADAMPTPAPQDDRRVLASATRTQTALLQLCCRQSALRVPSTPTAGATSRRWTRHQRLLWMSGRKVAAKALLALIAPSRVVTRIQTPMATGSIALFVLTVKAMVSRFP